MPGKQVHKYHPGGTCSNCPSYLKSLQKAEERIEQDRYNKYMNSKFISEPLFPSHL